MDPNTTWTNLKSELGADNGDEACEFAESLLDWINRGGFMPTNTPFMTREELTAYLIGVRDGIDCDSQRA